MTQATSSNRREQQQQEFHQDLQDFYDLLCPAGKKSEKRPSKKAIEAGGSGLTEQELSVWQELEDFEHTLHHPGDKQLWLV